MMEQKILVINTGSSSTKLALFNQGEMLWKEEVIHPSTDLVNLKTIEEEYTYRVQVLESWLKEKGIDLSSLQAIGCIGGILKPMEGGVYKVNQTLCEDILEGRTEARHASNLSALIGYDLEQKYDIPSFIVDPISTDETSPVAKISGLPTIPRKSRTHALNVKACMRRAVREKLIKAEDSVVVAHIGGGLTINLVANGRIIDIEDGRQCGPFSTEAAGAISTPDFIDYYVDNGIPKKELMKFWYGKGGFMAHTGNNSIKDAIEKAQNGDEKCQLLLDAMVYQITKSIGALYAVAEGKLSAIIFTGGASRSQYLIDKLKERTGWMASLIVYPGEEELVAIAESVQLVLAGTLPQKEYN
jgi:butyrate kinase